MSENEIRDTEQWLDNLDPDAADVEVRDPRALRRIGAAQLRIEQGEAELRNAVKAARAEGETWAAIGRTLGVTRQAAQERFGKNEPERTENTMNLSPRDLIHEIYCLDFVPMGANTRTLPDEYGTAILMIGERRVTLGADEDGDYLWTAEQREEDRAVKVWTQMDQSGTPDEAEARAYLTEWARVASEMFGRD